MSHFCHARGCQVSVPPSRLMCPHHWFQVPKVMRDRVWETYRAGQEYDKRPGRDYLVAARAAIAFVDNGEAQRRRNSTGAHAPQHGGK